METEIWKDIPGYEGSYRVSSFGRIYSEKKYGKGGHDGMFIKPIVDSHGYSVVTLNENGIGERKKLHRIIGDIFLENTHNRKEINHKNGIKTDNRVENLEWCTRSENMKHAYNELGVKSNFNINPPSKGKFGGENVFSKKVGKFNDKGELIGEYEGAREAQRILGINNISACCRGIQKTAGGFIWKYI